MTPIEELLNAVVAGDPAAVKAVLEKHPDAANQRAPDGRSAILEALYRGREDLPLLLAAQAPLDLFEAAALGRVERVRALVEKEPAAVSHFSPDGWSALHLAGFFAQREVAEYLLSHGASPALCSKNATANQPLHASLAGKRNREWVELLLTSGADINARAGHGVTPLHLAAARGDAELVELLYRKGANPHARMDNGTTVDEIAQQRNHPAVSTQIKSYQSAAGEAVTK